MLVEVVLVTVDDLEQRFHVGPARVRHQHVLATRIIAKRRGVVVSRWGGAAVKDPGEGRVIGGWGSHRGMGES